MQASLQAPALRPFPLGQIRPQGWLSAQLQVQAQGLTGHLDEFWPSVRDSRWIGGEAEGWERGPYWLDGLIPLAFLLDDAHLQAKAHHWVDYILDHQHPDGWLGAKDDTHEGEGLGQLDPWPLFVLFKAFLLWHEATSDARIVPALLRCALCVKQLLAKQPLRSWAKLRWADFSLSLQRLYELTGETWLLELSATAGAQGYDWISHFTDLPLKTKTTPDLLGPDVALPLHGVNNAMGLKTGAVRWRQTGHESDKANALHGLAQLDHYHGAPDGMFYADEHLAGKSPVQGFETCAVVEMMFSLEVTGAITGQAPLFDRLERIAFNALPASTTPDFWAHQYHQQTNQVLCSIAKRAWTDSGPRANVYGQDVNFGCCQANLHQGWPKFAASLWMQTPDDGVAATAYAPCQLEATIQGVAVTIEARTDYPFNGEIHFKLHCDQPISFPLWLRVPQWANGATLQVAGTNTPLDVEAGWCVLKREWQGGDEVTLVFELPIRTEHRERGTVCLHRGPLLLALRINEEFHALGSPYTSSEPKAQEWEVRPLSAWKFALSAEHMVSRTTEFKFSESALSNLPFDVFPPPFSVSIKAQRIQNWRIQNHSAALPPVLSIPSKSSPQDVTLVPYGCTHLRIAEFPIAKE